MVFSYTLYKAYSPRTSSDVANILHTVFVLSRRDYCSSLLSGCPQYLLNKLQKVQNNAARLVLRVSKTDHITPHLVSLHWLPVDSRIQYKLASLCYNCLSLATPVYSTELLTVYKPTRHFSFFIGWGTVSLEQSLLQI